LRLDSPSHKGETKTKIMKEKTLVTALAETKKRGKIKTTTFWVVTGLLVFQLAFSGIGALIKLDFLVASMHHLDLPLYIMNILGLAYVLGAIAIIVPGFSKLKEWAHAGVVFAMSAALMSHIMVGDGFEEAFPSLLIMSLNIASYLLRPDNRRFGK